MRRAGSLFGLFGAALVCAAATSCNGTTGDNLVTFSAFARGAAGAGQPFVVDGFTVQITSAKMRLGALYFDESPPSTGFDTPVCIAPGVYAAQVPGPIEIDLLSTTPEEFSVYGNGTADLAVSWQIWLTDGNVNEANFAHMVDLQGTATKDGQTYSFGAVVTINANNRQPQTSNPATPGENPICKFRIVQIGGVDVQFFQGGTLTVTVDPRAWFNENIDFSTLPLVTDDACLNADQVVPLTASDYALSPDAPASGSCGGSSQPCCTDAAGAPLPTGACQGALSCNDGVCGPTYCIPNTNFATGAGALQGVELFNGIYTGGSSAYAVTYSNRANASVATARCSGACAPSSSQSP